VRATAREDKRQRTIDTVVLKAIHQQTAEPRNTPETSAGTALGSSKAVKAGRHVANSTRVSGLASPIARALP